MAHAVLSVREQMEIACGATHSLDLSEQFVYWWCKERDGIPARNGTYLSMGMRCRKEAGARFESLWPYVQTPTTDQGQDPPPPDAATGDVAFSTTQTQEFSRSDITGIKACLVEGRSLTFSLPVTIAGSSHRQWPAGERSPCRCPGRTCARGHAMALVGYQDDAGALGGGYFLLRNSWQPWAWDGVWKAGYENALYVRVTNPASTYLYGVAGEVYFRHPETSGWERAGQFTEVSLRPGQTIIDPMAWLPPQSGRVHLALRLV